MTSEVFEGRRITRILKKLALAILMALLFALLGLSEGLGYRLHTLKELSFTPYNNLGFADVELNFSATYDPLLYPLYYIKGTGYVNAVQWMMYIPEAYGPGEFGRPVWGLKPSDRYEAYTIQMITWGFWPNMLLLLFITVLVEVARARVLYIAIFSGILGFDVAELPGMIAGLAVGLVLCLLIVFKLPKDNIITRFWNSLWQ